MNIDGSDKRTTETPGYSFGKTATKAAPPFIVIILVQAAKAALAQSGIQIDDNTLYAAALAGYGAIAALINWLKNRKKGK